MFGNLFVRPRSRRGNRRQSRPRWLAGGMEQLESRQLFAAYYIDPETGSDANPGTEARPYQTVRHLTTWADTPGNTNCRRLAAGDTVYLREGVHDWSSLLASIGLEVTGTYGAGIRVTDTTEVEIAYNYIHDVDGNHDNNIAGIDTLDTIGLHIHQNLLHDDYDHARAQQPGDLMRENSRNIVIFGDGSDRVEVDHNKVFNTPPSSGIPSGMGRFGWSKERVFR